MIHDINSFVCLYECVREREGERNLVGFGVLGGLGVLSLFDVLHHLPEEGVTVVLVLHHQHLQHKPQAPKPPHTHRHTLSSFHFSWTCLAKDPQANRLTL